MKYNLKDIAERIYKEGEVEFLGHKGLRSSTIPLIDLVVYIKELELRIEQLEKNVNSKELADNDR